jgi:hypothetical protein
MTVCSPRFARAITDPVQHVVIHAELWTAGLTAVLHPDLPLIGGQVTIDRTAGVRRSVGTSFADADGSLTPILLGDNNNDPFPAELLVWRGLDFGGGLAPEIFQLGVFGIAQSDVVRGIGNVLSVTGYDRSKATSQNGLIDPYVIQPGTAYTTAATTLVDNQLPFAVTHYVDTSANTVTGVPIVYPESDDPWGRVIDLSSSVGCETYFRPDGAHQIQDWPDPMADAVAWELVHGENCIYDAVQQSKSNDPGYNGVLVIGENSGNETLIPRALAVDNDPNSPTYWSGNYGRRRLLVNDSTITSNAQATVVANATLRKVLGQTHQITVNMIPNPAMDVSEVVRIQYKDELDVQMLLEQLTIPLDVNTLASATARARRTA